MSLLQKQTPVIINNVYKKKLAKLSSTAENKNVQELIFTKSEFAQTSE